MSVVARVHAEDLPEEALQGFVRELSIALNDQRGLTAELPSRAAAVGERGDPVALGTLVITFLSSGAAVAFLEVARAYFERRGSMSIELTRTDGRKVRIRADSMKRSEVDRTLAALEAFIGE